MKERKKKERKKKRGGIEGNENVKKNVDATIKTWEGKRTVKKKKGMIGGTRLYQNFTSICDDVPSN